MTKYSNEDIEYLAQCIKNSKDSGDKPFAFLIGAGVSKSAGIPLASQLIKEINSDDKFKIHLRKLATDEKSSYPKCMEALTKDERRQLLGPHLKKAQVNWANLAIASMLKPKTENSNGGYIKRLLTFNFDNILARSCGIFGYYPAIYDFSETPPKDFEFMSDGAITHLHGQGTGLKMLNTNSETGAQANALVNLFIDTFAHYNLVVIGYSGLADNAFEEFKNKFENRTRLFWVGHSDDPDPHIKELLDIAPKTSHYFGGADADIFLLELAKKLECWPPKIFTSPEEHLLDELRPIISYPTDAGENILDILRQDLEEKSKQRHGLQQDLKGLLLQGKYDEIIENVGKSKNKEDVNILAWAYNSKADKLASEAINNRNVDLFKESFKLYDMALKIIPEFAPAYNNFGVAMSEYAKLKNDESFYEIAIDKFENALLINPKYTNALNNFGATLVDLAKLKNDNTFYEKAIEKFEISLQFNDNDADVLNNYGTALANLAKIKGDEKMFKGALDKFKRSLEIKPNDVYASNNYNATLIDFAKLKKEDSLFHEAIQSCLETEKNTGKSSYNLACIYGLLKLNDDCKMQLMKCLIDGTLPNKQHLVEDEDLEFMRDKAWFEKLINKLD